MNLSRPDFPYIRLSLYVFLGVVGAGAAAVTASGHFAELAQRERAAAQQQLERVRDRLVVAREDRVNMQDYALEYGELLAHNVIGAERRLEWIEDIETIGRRQRLPGLKYAISAQRPYAPPPAVDSGPYELGWSGMSLQFELLHEQQLLDFFDTLRADGRGRFVPDHCALERTEAAATGPQLKAECTGGWLTLQRRSAA